MGEQREQQDEGQRPAAEVTDEVADDELEQASGGYRETEFNFAGR